MRACSRRGVAALVLLTACGRTVADDSDDGTGGSAGSGANAGVGANGGAGAGVGSGGTAGSGGAPQSKCTDWKLSQSWTLGHDFAFAAIPRLTQLTPQGDRFALHLIDHTWNGGPGDLWHFEIEPWTFGSNTTDPLTGAFLLDLDTNPQLIVTAPSPMSGRYAMAFGSKFASSIDPGSASIGSGIASSTCTLGRELLAYRAESNDYVIGCSEQDGTQLRLRTLKPTGIATMNPEIVACSKGGISEASAVTVGDGVYILSTSWRPFGDCEPLVEDENYRQRLQVTYFDGATLTLVDEYDPGDSGAQEPRLVAMADSLWLVWRELNTDALRAQRVRFDGTPVTPAFDITHANVVGLGAARVGNGLAVVSAEIPIGLSIQKLHLRFFDAGGTLLRAIESDDNVNTSLAVAGDPNGGNLLVATAHPPTVRRYSCQH